MRRANYFVGRLGGGAEHRGAVAVLERQPDAVVPFDGAAHCVAGHHSQQLPAGGLIGGRDLVVGQVGLRGWCR